MQQIRKTRYQDILRSDISKFVSFFACPTLDDMISGAQQREIDLEQIGQRKEEHGQTIGVSVKKPKDFDSISKGQQGRSCRGNCGRSQVGTCRVGGSDNYKCGKTGHFSKD